MLACSQIGSYVRFQAEAAFCAKLAKVPASLPVSSTARGRSALPAVRDLLIQRELNTMDALVNIMLGYAFGFMLGVGCALAVMYTIWTGGYRRGVEHSLMEQPPERFTSARASIERRRVKTASKPIGPER